MIQKYIKKYYSKGYVLIPNLIGKNLCEKLKKLLEADYKKYSKKYATNKVEKIR